MSAFKCVAAFWCFVAAAACRPGAPASHAARDVATVVTARATETLAALKAKDMPRLATLVHPTLGVRFSPYAYVRVDADRGFDRAAVAALWTDTTRYLWGIADGSGDPIELPFAKYYARFVFDRDFTQAPQTAFTAEPLQRGNTPSNLATAYPGAKWVEYHVPGSNPKYGGMDWSSLWLVFQPEGDQWFLVGIVHGAWTI